MERPSWDQYFSKIALLTSERSNCIRRKIGCVIVKNNSILSLGYNGTPRGTKNCYEGGCPRCANSNSSGSNLEFCLCIHAEENALFFNSLSNLDGAKLYVTTFPCINCAIKIKQCGITQIVYLYPYSEYMDKISEAFLSENGVQIKKISIVN
jgi:dCMP deaminase